MCKIFLVALNIISLNALRLPSESEPAPLVTNVSLNGEIEDEAWSNYVNGRNWMTFEGFDNENEKEEHPDISVTLRSNLGERAWIGKDKFDRMLAGYAHTHQQEIEKGKSGRFIVVCPYHGLGNRLHSIISSLALAMETDRALFVKWDRSPDCTKEGDCDPAGMDDLFLSPEGINFHLPTFIDQNICKSAEPLRTRWQTSTGGKSLVEVVDQAHGDTQTVLVYTDQFFLDIVGCRGDTKKPSSFPGPLTAYGLLLDYFMKPRPIITDRVSNALKKYGKCAIGVHIRKGRMNPEQANDLLKQKDKNVGIFIAADMAATSQQLKTDITKFAEKYGARIISISGHEATRSTLNGIYDAMAENYLLAECESILPSPPQHSTYSMIAHSRAATKQGWESAAINADQLAFAKSYGWTQFLDGCAKEGVN